MLERSAHQSWDAPDPTQFRHKLKWSALEDDQLKQAIDELGITSWNQISQRVPTRSGKQCRERWINQLSPSISKDIWLPEEDALLAQFHPTTGNRWTALAVHLPGRSALSIKNRWNWLTRRSPPSGLHDLPLVLPVQPLSMDIIERRKPARLVFEPLGEKAAAFGPAFQKFQAKMFLN
jgi:hypothetical protein